LPLKPNTIDPRKSLTFLQPHITSLSTKKESQDAFVLASMESAHYKLIISDLEGCKTCIDECKKIIDSLEGLDIDVNANFYRVSADYYKVKINDLVLF
jgi:26S proteasome regulatory subunit N9